MNDYSQVNFMTDDKNILNLCRPLCVNQNEMKGQILKILIIASTGLTGCSNNDLGRSAVITGYDPRYCACCGGLMINFENNAQSFTGDFYLIENSGDVGIPINTTFPVYAIVTYTVSSNTCSGKHIRINSSRQTK